MRSAFSIAAFAMIKSSSNSPSECVMPTGVNNEDAIVSTVFQCYAGLSISFTGSSSANTDSGAPSSGFDVSITVSDFSGSGSDSLTVGTDISSSVWTDISGSSWTDISSSGWADTSSSGSDFFSLDGSDLAIIGSDSGATLDLFCASSSCKQMLVDFKQLWPTDCSVDGVSLYERIDELNSECSWSSTGSKTTAIISGTTSLTGSSALALAATSAAALLLQV